MVRMGKHKKKRRINNVTATTIIKSNVESLKTSYNADPSKKRHGRFQLKSDLEYINEIFGNKKTTPASFASPLSPSYKKCTNINDLKDQILADDVSSDDTAIVPNHKTNKKARNTLKELQRSNKLTPILNNIQKHQFSRKGADETFDTFCKRIDEDTKKKHAALPSVMFNSRRREKLKKFQEKRRHKIEQKANEQKDRETDRNRLKVKEVIHFGEVVQRPPTNLHSANYKKQIQHKKLGLQNILRQDDDVNEGIIVRSSLPDHIVQKLSGTLHQNHHPHDIRNLARQAYQTLKLKRRSGNNKP